MMKSSMIVSLMFGVAAAVADPKAKGGKGKGLFDGLGDMKDLFNGDMMNRMQDLMPDFSKDPECSQKFTCKAGQIAVQKFDTELKSHGCDHHDAFGGEFFGTKLPSIDHCCVQRDVCKHTCMMSYKECHDQYVQCITDACEEGDDKESCVSTAKMLSPDIGKGPKAMEKLMSGHKLHELPCHEYDQLQKEHCECLDQGEAAVSLDVFYHNIGGDRLKVKDAHGKDFDFEKIATMSSEEAQKYAKVAAENMLVAHAEDPENPTSVKRLDEEARKNAPKMPDFSKMFGGDGEDGAFDMKKMMDSMKGMFGDKGDGEGFDMDKMLKDFQKQMGEMGGEL